MATQIQTIKIDTIQVITEAPGVVATTLAIVLATARRAEIKDPRLIENLLDTSKQMTHKLCFIMTQIFMMYCSSRGVPTSNPSSGYGYSNNNNNNNNGNALLRTGRNLSNSELNSLARNRSGSNSMKKESPVNSRRPPAQQQQAQQNGMRATYVRGPAPSNSGGGGGGGGGFCGECGSAFPVEWAKFCSFCGDRRF